MRAVLGDGIGEVDTLRVVVDHEIADHVTAREQHLGGGSGAIGGAVEGPGVGGAVARGVDPRHPIDRAVGRHRGRAEERVEGIDEVRRRIALAGKQPGVAIEAVGPVGIHGVDPVARAVAVHRGLEPVEHHHHVVRARPHHLVAHEHVVVAVVELPHEAHFVGRVDECGADVDHRGSHGGRVPALQHDLPGDLDGLHRHGGEQEGQAGHRWSDDRERSPAAAVRDEGINEATHGATILRPWSLLGQQTRTPADSEPPSRATTVGVATHRWRDQTAA